MRCIKSAGIHLNREPREQVAQTGESASVLPMSRLAAKEQFLTDAKGKRTGVVLDLATSERLREAAEVLSDIRAYDALHDRAHAEIAAGQFETLASYRASRSRFAPTLG